MTINLGNILQFGDKQIAGGISSNLDLGAIVDSLVAAKQIPIDVLVADTEVNDLKITEFGTYRTLLSTFQTAMDLLRNPPGVNKEADNIFEYRTVALAATGTTTAASSFLSITTSPGAQLGGFDVEVTNLAKATSITTQIVTSNTASITEAFGGSTSGSFSAGTFEIGASLFDNKNALDIADFTISGTAVGVLTAAGAHNLINTGIGGADRNLFGNFDDISITYDTDNNEIDIEITMNGSLFAARDIALVAADMGDDLFAGDRFTFANSAGISFEIELSGNIDLDDQAEADTFASDLTIALAPQSIAHSREIGNFDSSTTTGTVLAGLESDDVLFRSDNFDSLVAGALEEFAVTAVTAPAAADGTITVVIDGQTFQATGLGSGGSDTHTANITLSSTTTSDQIFLNINDAGVTLDFTDSTTAQTIEDDLISTFGISLTSISLTGDFDPAVFTLSGIASTTDYTITGAGAGVLTAAGIHNITLLGLGDNNFIGGPLTPFSVDYDAVRNEVDIEVTINGSLYAARGIALAAGGGGDDLFIGDMFTLTNAETGMSFVLELGSNIDLDDQAEADTFAGDLDTALAGQTISHDRGINNFDVTLTTGTVLDGLTAADTFIRNDVFDAAFSGGVFGDFTVTAVTGPGNNDGIISIVIDGETFENTGLGTGGGDTHTANITLSSTTTNKEFFLNINDAGVTLDFSDVVAAQTIEADLDTIFSKSKTAVTGDSLVDIAAKFNAVKSTTGVSASVIKITDGNYQLRLSSDKTGSINSFGFADPDRVIRGDILTSTQKAEDSEIVFEGISVFRDSNSFNDLVTDVTFNLLSETPTGASVSVVVARDTKAADSGIINFLNAYNDFRIFTERQGEVDDEGNLLDDAILGADTTLKTIELQVTTELTAVIAGISSSNLTRLSEIGITFIDFEGDDETPPTTNLLTIDQDVLDDALENNFDQVRALFEFTFTADSTDISVFSRSNDITLTSYKLDIDDTRDAGEEVRVLDSSNNFLFFGALTTLSSGAFKITGVDDTALEGMVYIYTGNASETITITNTQGVGDRLYNLLDGVLTEDGILDVAVDEVVDDSESIDDEIIKLEEQLETFRDTLIRQFAALEAAISRVNTLLQFLESQNDVLNAKN